MYKPCHTKLLHFGKMRRITLNEKTADLYIHHTFKSFKFSETNGFVARFMSKKKKVVWQCAAG